MLIQYLRKHRKGRNEKVGVLVAESKDGGFVVGWSLTNRKDSFNKEHGMRIAIGRIDELSATKIPQSIRVSTLEFAKRCTRYFKSNMVWPREESFRD